MAIQQTTALQQDYLDTVSSFVADTSYDDLPENVRQHAKYVWMDTVGVILAGSVEPQNSALSERLSVGGGPATILRPGFPRCDAMNAALANGTSGTFLELDEGHRPTSHPAVYIVPPVLALGEVTGASGKQLIEALVLAYDVTARIAKASRFVDGVHIHGCLGVVGAAAGAARLLGYDAPATREAINVASFLNGATPSRAVVEGALVRNVYSGFAGHMGVLIAELVKAGFTGPRDGPSETYTKLIGNSFDPQEMLNGLGDDYQITSNYFKLHAACRHLHPPIDALEQALKGRRLRPEQVKRVTVVGNHHVVRYGRPDPGNALAAKFSVPFAIATRIARNSAGMDAFQQDAVDDPATRALAQRVKLEESVDFNGRLPYDHPARVEIELVSGETLVGEVDNARGDRGSQVSYEEVVDKFSSLTSFMFPDGKVAQAVDLFTRLEEMPQAGDLTAALRRLAG